MQIRIGPEPRRARGLLQPIADAVKLLFKEIIIPPARNKALFVLAPIMTIMPALAAWAVIPFGPELVLADVNAGLLYVMAITSMGVYGVIIAGWASNSKYAFLGAMRSSAQMVSYEIAMGFALVVVLMMSGTLNLCDIVDARPGHVGGMGLTSCRGTGCRCCRCSSSTSSRASRRPTATVRRGRRRIGDRRGAHVEYSGMSFAMFFLAEYANMILVSTLCSIDVLRRLAVAVRACCSTGCPAGCG